MVREETFDSFYRATRRQVLHQAFALTGDLPAAQSAVRDAYVGAWQHWRKVSRLDDPLDWVRPRAWQLAQRRHTARIWHRNKGMSDAHKSVLDALSRRPVAQRRVLLLVELAGLDLAHTGRELGITRDVAEHNLRIAREGLAESLGTDVADVHDRLAGLDALLDSASLPRGPIVRRAGRKRRQGHAVVGIVAASVVALASGAFAYQPDASTADADLKLVTPEAPATTADPAEDAATAKNLLDQDQIRRLGLGQRWRVGTTSNNTSGDGINTVCQQSRFADPEGKAALVRTFAAGGKPGRSAVQTVEVSKSAAKAAAAFRTTVGWYAGCRVGRLQVLNAYRVDNIGDEAQRPDGPGLEEARHHDVRRRRPHRPGDHVHGRHDRRGVPAAGLGDHPVPRGRGGDALWAQRLRRLRQAADLPRRSSASVRRGARHPGRRRPAPGGPDRAALGRHQAGRRPREPVRDDL